MRYVYEHGCSKPLPTHPYTISLSLLFSQHPSFCSSSGGPCGDGFNQGSVAANTPARGRCFLGSDVGACGTRHFTFGLDVTKPLNDGLNSYYRGQGAVSFKIVEAPAASNVGPVSTGGGDELSSGMGFVIVREKTQPTVMFPVPVCTLQPTPPPNVCLNSQLIHIVSF